MNGSWLNTSIASLVNQNSKPMFNNEQIYYYVVALGGLLILVFAFSVINLFRLSSKLKKQMKQHSSKYLNVGIMNSLPGVSNSFDTLIYLLDDDVSEHPQILRIKSRLRFYLLMTVVAPILLVVLFISIYILFKYNVGIF